MTLQPVACYRCGAREACEQRQDQNRRALRATTRSRRSLLLTMLVAAFLCTGCPVRDQIEENSVRDSCRIETNGKEPAYSDCVRRQGVEP